MHFFKFVFNVIKVGVVFFMKILKTNEVMAHKNVYFLIFINFLDSHFGCLIKFGNALLFSPLLQDSYYPWYLLSQSPGYRCRYLEVWRRAGWFMQSKASQLTGHSLLSCRFTYPIYIYIQSCFCEGVGQIVVGMLSGGVLRESASRSM